MLINRVFYGLFPLIFTSAFALASIDVVDLLEDSDSRTNMTVMFQQTASAGTDATVISKIRLAYFTSTDCTGSKAGSGFYTTPDGTSFTISVGTAFGMVAASTWSVGSSKLSIADMTTIQSIAITFKSTNSNTPQAAFTNGSSNVISYACVPVTCSSGECTSGSGTQSFTLKTTASVGDPADGGIIACQNTGSDYNIYDLVIATEPYGSTIGWGGAGTTTGATSTTDGASNTSTIVNCLTNLTGCVSGTPGSPIATSAYSAGICFAWSDKAGFTSDWFLPTGNNANAQLSCIYNNKTAINTGLTAAGGSSLSTVTSYYSSTEASANNAYMVSLSTGNTSSSGKAQTARRTRCVRAF